MVAAEIEVFGKSKFKSQHHGYDQLERKSIRQTHDQEIQEDVNGPIDCKMFLWNSYSFYVSDGSL